MRFYRWLQKSTESAPDEPRNDDRPDWSSYMVEARKRLLKAENSLSLGRKSEGAAAILMAIGQLNELLDSLDA